MREYANKHGTVRKYNRMTGWATADLDDGEVVEFSTLCFRSGRPPRHPSTGDRIEARVRADGIVLTARLVK